MKTKLFFLLVALFTITANAQHEDFWVQQNTNFSEVSQGIRNISIVNDQVVWAVAYDGSASSGNTQAYTRTTDGGETWTSGAIDIGSTGSGIAMIHAVSADTAYIIAYPNAGGDAQGVYITTNGGTSWTRQDTALYNDSVAFANVVYFWDENNGFAQGDPVGGYYELYTTTDGGNQWSRVPSDQIPAPSSGEYGYVSQIYVTGDRLWFTTNKGRIYRSDDHGHNWVVFQSPITDFGSASSSGEISFADADHGYLTNQEGLFWSTTDGGENWAIGFPGGDGIVFPGDICAIPGTNAVVVAGAGDLHGTAYSLDGGLTFSTMCDTDQHLDTQFLNGTTGWSGAFNGGGDADDPTIGGMYKYVGPQLATANLLTKGFVSYPNPVVDFYKMSAIEDITNVSVHNLLGQQVYKAQPNALTHDIDMSALPHGTYIVNVTIDGVQGSVKVVK